jgi:integrase
MSVRKRTWITSKGEEKSAWVVDYLDTKGTRRLKSFRLKKEADAFAATAKVEVRDGTHVPDSASVTVREAGEKWIKAAGRRVERGTLVQYRQLLELHIAPFIGSTLLSRLTVPAVRDFEDKLLDEGRSPVMARKIIGGLGSLLADAQERGLVVRNVVREKSRARRKGSSDRRIEKRHKGRLKIGEDIPTPGEVKALVGSLSGRWRPLLLTAIFTGLRASEIRGLRWQDVNLERKEIHVRQRADRFNDISKPKSEAGERTVPVPPIVINALKEWRLACPRPRIGEDAEGKPILDETRPAQLVFPNGLGKVESLSNIMQRGFLPAQVAAGVAVATAEVDKDGKPVMKAKYTGLHALRHFYASWLINRREDGGLGLPPKSVQDRLGHSTISLTMDIYSHLFPRADDAEELASAEAALLG